MLDFRLNVSANLDIKRIQYPIYFEKRNICVHCGQENTLLFVDKFGNETRKDIHPFDHIKCKHCNSIYSILWQNDPDNNNKMYPTAVDPGIKQEFLNIMNHKNIKHKGEKSF